MAAQCGVRPQERSRVAQVVWKTGARNKRHDRDLAVRHLRAPESAATPNDEGQDRPRRTARPVDVLVHARTGAESRRDRICLSERRAAQSARAGDHVRPDVACHAALSGLQWRDALCFRSTALWLARIPCHRSATLVRLRCLLRLAGRLFDGPDVLSLRGLHLAESSTAGGPQIPRETVPAPRRPASFRPRGSDAGRALPGLPGDGREAEPRWIRARISRPAVPADRPDVVLVGVIGFDRDRGGSASAPRRESRLGGPTSRTEA